MSLLRGALLAALSPLCACVLPPAAIPPAETHLDYASPSSWVCRGDLPTDVCRKDMDAIAVAPDGARRPVPFVPAKDPDVDCFYVYPTVDMSLRAGSHDDFADTTRMQDVARAQIAHFGQVCRVFAPLYRQVTIGTYLVSAERRENRLALAFDDVVTAFDWYVAHASAGHRIVLVGHSQGAEMVIRLLRERFERDAAMRARLLVAMPIGALYLTDQFDHIPLCSSDDQTACVVTYRSYLAGRPVHPWSLPPSGKATACVNPADLAGNERKVLAGTVWPTHTIHSQLLPIDELSPAAPFAILEGAYAARCVDAGSGQHVLAIESLRTGRLDLDSGMWRSDLGLHLLDLQLPQTELIDIVRRRAERGAATPGADRSSRPPGAPSP